jgi:hypothetical protein
VTAAFAGIAAAGVVIARDQRRRRAYTPEEIRARLHARLTEASTSPPETTAAPDLHGSDGGVQPG